MSVPRAVPDAVTEMPEGGYRHDEIQLQANPDIFTSRMLAKKSGYGLGTLTRRLSSIEHVFLWAIYKARERKF